MRKIDYHLHTQFSFDSQADPEEHIKQAIALGLDEICFTDHYDFAYPNADFTMNLSSYFQTMKALQEKYANELTIKIGLEMGLDWQHQEEIKQLLTQYPFDFVIGSIHVINHQEFEKNGYFVGKSKTQAHRDYFQACLDCAKTFDCFNVFGHYDYIERYGPYEDKKVDLTLYQDLIDEFLKTIISKEIGLEVNTSGFKLRGEGFPQSSILKRYYDLGGRIVTIGSDSHTSDRVGEHVNEVIKTLKKIGFEDVATFTNHFLDA